LKKTWFFGDFFGRFWRRTLDYGLKMGISALKSRSNTQVAEKTRKKRIGFERF
jgi:hypothetical protein